jgi:hypothetical protein
VKALLVTSRITFTPDNYDELVIGLAHCPEVGGLLILDNESRDLTIKGAALIALGAFGMGSNMLINQFGRSHKRRVEAYESVNKPVWVLKTVNCPEAQAIITEHKFDIVSCLFKEARVATCGTSRKIRPPASQSTACLRR